LKEGFRGSKRIEAVRRRANDAVGVLAALHVALATEVLGYAEDEEAQGAEGRVYLGKEVICRQNVSISST